MGILINKNYKLNKDFIMLNLLYKLKTNINL